MPPPPPYRTVRTVLTLFAAVLAHAALAQIPASLPVDRDRSTVPLDEVRRGGPPPQGIPAIGFGGLDGVAAATEQPAFVSPDEAADWLGPREPVIRIELGGEVRLYPMQILVWHEIVNDTIGDVPVAVTFCPLCNSALAFDRRLPLDEERREELETHAAELGLEVRVGPTDEGFRTAAREQRLPAPDRAAVTSFGVSGLLYASNMLMFDDLGATLWSQLVGTGTVGILAGSDLVRYAAPVTSFEGAIADAPEALVMDRPRGFSRAYGTNPYVGYDDVGSPAFLFDGEADDRLEAKLRVVAIDDDPAVAYPLPHLRERAVVHDRVGNRELVLAWWPGTASAIGGRRIAQADDVGSVAVFEARLGDRELSFEIDGQGLRDAETGTRWNASGQAVEGPLAGERLTPVLHDLTLWFAWAAFRPDTEIRRP